MAQAGLEGHCEDPGFFSCALGAMGADSLSSFALCFKAGLPVEGLQRRGRGQPGGCRAGRWGQSGRPGLPRELSRMCGVLGPVSRKDVPLRDNFILEFAEMLRL